MSSESLEDALETVQEELESLGVDDALAREVVSYRLLVERLGEERNNEWWESIVFTETGRDRLEEVTPKTAVKARIDLAQRIGRKVEQDRLPENTVSLFYLGPTAESQIDAELENIGKEDVPFDALESLSITFDEAGWADGLVDDTEPAIDTTETVMQIGDISDESELKSRRTLREVARQCVVAYGHSTHNSLRVPYYNIDR
ncbi:BrxE family protein [Natronorubrum daqingense]|uniref:Uncharacterized protein n=1 Tax=Natronorubrum daqingense TaxID=588898 RepID=A0A1N7CA56_9EURY|nr:BrxE family protein [Natronorubrum daqingense]APX96811.1 hypothetical protein BB347_09365 [Natronorubrum daqingense]SIR60489.1 hypothetical protein SAMN05421809_1597 [Natronorubrum daqingense]